METTAELTYLQTLLPLVAVVFIIAIGVVLMYQQFRKSLFKQELAKEALQRKHQLELLRTTIDIQEEERKRFAQDLHDELGASLSISRMHLLRLESMKADDVQVVANELPKIREYVEGALLATRRISHELMPQQLEQLGLPKALSAFASNVESATGIATNITLYKGKVELPWPLALGVYRIFTELCNNTVKHAQASSISFQLELENDALLAHYSDNGKGVTQDVMVAGVGLKSIEARIKALSGDFLSTEQNSPGYVTAFSLPLSTEE